MTSRISRLSRVSQACTFRPAELKGIGLDSENLDLRKYFGRPEELERELRRFGMVWVLGGNAFLLMRAMRQGGFSEVIVELLRNDHIAYGGFGAGAVAATPHLRGLELMDDPSQLADQYQNQVVWDGLGLVDFSIVPHYDSDHTESYLAALTVSFIVNLLISTFGRDSTIPVVVNTSP
ncbi:Type 1 glutamine amidotransferase-like domain-containing protein [Achromobacter xylosoxidans]|uniref:Type 1 glutamine amidotransferase-like domain-containing protein n=1 Tax=Alcaligenes xylosoxydans xylosoxydans TaxID=85698 RepID=UPI0030B9E670